LQCGVKIPPVSVTLDITFSFVCVCGDIQIFYKRRYNNFRSVLYDVLFTTFTT